MKRIFWLVLANCIALALLAAACIVDVPGTPTPTRTIIVRAASTNYLGEAADGRIGGLNAAYATARLNDTTADADEYANRHADTDEHAN